MIGNMGVLVGIFCVYLWVLFFLDTFSENKADMSQSYISKVQAKLNFFEDSEGWYKYWNEIKSSSEKNIRLYNRWSSNRYPEPRKYSQLTVSPLAEPEPVSSKIVESINVITRFSH